MNEATTTLTCAATMRLNSSTINPSFFGSVDDGRSVFLVDFDVQVSVTESSGGSVGGKLTIAPLFLLGADAKTQSGNSAASRITFRVPLALPVDQVTHQEVKRARQEREAATQRAIRKSQNMRSDWRV